MRFVGFSTSKDIGAIAGVRVSYQRADFAQIEVPEFGLYGAKWVGDALPPRLSFDKITLQWRHTRARRCRAATLAGRATRRATP